MKSFLALGLRRRWKAVLLGAGALLALAALFIATGDYRPLALVNGSPLSAGRFDRNAAAAEKYYENLVKTYEKDGEGEMASEEIRTAVLTQLIEAELIAREVRKEVGGDLEYLVSNKIGRYKDDANLRRAAPALYGMQFEEFWQEVLVPQAERDILAGRLFLRGEKIEDWLAGAKSAANVIMLSKEFRWNGAAVEPAGGE